MKSLKTRKLIYTILMAVIVITVCSYGISTYGNSSARRGTDAPRFENLKGNAEFYFTPSDDNRVWHVVNTYHSPGSEGQKTYNESEYTFGSDSVYVVNEYAGIPQQNGLDLAMSR